VTVSPSIGVPDDVVGHAAEERSHAASPAPQDGERIDLTGLNPIEHQMV
jgi:hypothetical protein